MAYGSPVTTTPTPLPLARRLGTVDAIVIGLGAMLGAGVFSAFAPAAQAAGGALLAGLVIAAIVAFCNATSSAQLAARYPVSGGAYVYGRERLGEWWGFAAGWSFVVGKTASCAAMSLVFAAYAVPPSWQKPVAIAAVALLVGVNLLGVTRTAALARVLVAIVLLVLVTVIVVGGGSLADGLGIAASNPLDSADPYEILQAAGLLFFAFAGYARIATMGEEVRDPARTIPTAIVASLAIALILYVALALILLGTLGADALARSTAPLRDAVAASGASWADPAVRIGAAAGSLGALLALITGLGRTTLAMARTGDLPRSLASISPRQVPVRAELAVGLAVIVLVATVDLRTVIGFSSFGVLLYYAVANAAAFTQPAHERRWPRALQVLGVAGCVTLVATVPVVSLVVGIAVLAVGCTGRLVMLRLRERAGRTG